MCIYILSTITEYKKMYILKQHIFSKKILKWWNRKQNKKVKNNSVYKDTIIIHTIPLTEYV